MTVTAIPGQTGFERRRRLLTMLLAAPVVIVAVGLSGIEGWRLMWPRSALFTSPFAYSLAEAIAAGDVEQAYAYVRAGHDPNQPIAVRDSALTGGRWVLSPPLLWAAATGQTQVVKMLLGYGVRTSDPSYPRALCIADTLGHEEIGRLLRALAPDVRADRCRAGRADDALLLRALETRGAADR
jgi:hypothetical protein